MKNKSKSQYRRKMKSWTFTVVLIAAVYCALMLFEALFYGGDMKNALLTTAAGASLGLVAVIVYIFFPRFKSVSFFLTLCIQAAFIAIGVYLEELNFYFYVLLLIIGAFSFVKDFRYMALFEFVSFICNIWFFIAVVPHLEWIDHYRFFMQFVLFQFGALIMLIQVYHVSQKEGRSERALTAFSSLLRSTPNLMVITDARSCVMYLSEPMVKFIQCPSYKYAIGQPLIDLIADRDLKMMFADMLDADGFYETVKSLEIEGEERHFKIIADNLSGEIDGIFIDISDITQMENIRQAALKAQKSAENANKSKSRFLATMSHEIRTPMNAITGIAQMQLLNKDLPPDYSHALHNIYNSGNNLLGIINDILDMSKIETGKLELNPIEYDVPSFIHDTIQINLVRLGSKPIKFILDIDAALPSRLFGDELRLKQILTNLLSNAFKYTEKGSVTLTIKHFDGENGDVRLSFIVEDTGQGMKPEDCENLFKEYTRFNAEANRDIEGTGLGLDITKSLVHMMDGVIKAESEYGKGTVFTVTVKQTAVECKPIGADVAERMMNFTFFGEKQITNLQVTRKLMPDGKVLVVDDIDTNLYVAEGLMSPYGLKIEKATSGFEAIDKLKNGNVYDIIFMDHMMPKMDGIETTKKMRESGYRGVIIALTANALAGNDEMFKQNGFEDFIAKPIDVRFLNEILEKWIPKEKQIKPEQTPDVDSAPEEQCSELKIEGVNIEKGLSNTGGAVEVYLRTLSVFLKDGINKTEQIKQALEKDDIPLYTVYVHAIKSAAASVGAGEVSELAKNLEDAGNRKDTAYIEKNNGVFLSELEMLLNNIGAVLKKDDAPEGELDKELLMRLKDALGDMNASEVNEIIGKLPPSPLTEQLSQSILMFEYEEAAALIENII